MGKRYYTREQWRKFSESDEVSEEFRNRINEALEENTEQALKDLGSPYSTAIKPKPNLTTGDQD